MEIWWKDSIKLIFVKVLWNQTNSARITPWWHCSYISIVLWNDLWKSKYILDCSDVTRVAVHFYWNLVSYGCGSLILNAPVMTRDGPYDTAVRYISSLYHGSEVLMDASGWCLSRAVKWFLTRAAVDVVAILLVCLLQLLHTLCCIDVFYVDYFKWNSLQSISASW